MRSELTGPPGVADSADDAPIAADEFDDSAADNAVGDDQTRDAFAEQSGGQAATGLAPQASDEMLTALLRRIVYQDEAALATFYRALSSRVFTQAMRITRDVGCAQEVVEDVFWQVWRQAPRFDPQRGSALAWVRRIARSRALDTLRAMGRNPLRWAVDLDDHNMVEPGSSHDDPPRRMGEAQATALLEQALAALDPLRRQLVAMAFQRGYSQSEIAEQTGLPLGTVKSHIRRALMLMKVSINAVGSPAVS